MKPTLTPCVQRFYNWLEDYLETRNISPSYREMANAMGHHTTSSVQSYVVQLEQKGLIVRDSHKARSIRLVQQAKVTRGVPVLGTIAAGGVVESFEQETVWRDDLPQQYWKRDNYALKIMGDSMIEAHICPGDLVVLRKEPDPRLLKPNSIVAARVEGLGTTFKHFHLKGDRAVLTPANPNYRPIEEDATRVEIQGVMIALWRDYR